MAKRTLYNHVALVTLSKDKDGETWVHFGVELRGRGDKRRPQLSTFGGTIDTVEGVDEHPVNALLREVHEETLGMYDEALSFEQLTNPDKTFSFSYTNPKDKSSTVVFATMIEHPEDAAKFQEDFEQERDDRMHKRHGKRFTCSPETELKQIRMVKLSELKKHLEETKTNPKATLTSATATGEFLSIDRDSKVFNEKNELTDYKVLKEDGKPVKTNIPTAIPLRHEVASSLLKVISSLEHRLLGKDLFEYKDMSKGFFGKSIRADEFSYIDEFIDTLPIEKLGGKQRKSKTRTGRHEPYTVRGTGMYDRQLKKELGIGKQYTEDEKGQYTAFQSLSYFSVADGTPVFGWSKERSTRLLGIADVDMLPNRLFIHDSGTFRRPYEGTTRQELESYVEKRAFSENQTMFDVSDLDAFKEKVKETKDKNYNEVLGRIRWNPNRTSICVYSDNIETRWLAIDWANKVTQKIQALSKTAFDEGRITKEEHEFFQQYKAPITFYDYNNKKVGTFTQEQLKKDKTEAIATFDNPTERQNRFYDNDYEFLLMVDDKKRLKEIIEDESLMKSLLEKRLHIAESIIDRHGEPYTIKNVTTLKLENVTRSFMEKLSQGKIGGFQKDKHGRIMLNGFNIKNKDFSGMDLSGFNFNNSSFFDVCFNDAQLSIKAEDAVCLGSCDLSGIKTNALDFTNVKIYGYFIYNDKVPNLQVFSKIADTEEFLKNHTLHDLLSIIKSEPKKTPREFVKFACRLAAREGDVGALESLLRRAEIKRSNLKALEISYSSNSDIVKLILDPKFVLNAQETHGWTILNKHGDTSLMIAAQHGYKKAVELLLSKNANVDAKNENSETALMHAAKYDRKEIVELLLKNKANVEAREHYGRTALMHTAIYGRKEIVELLLKNNVNVETQDKNGETALMYAAERGYKEIVELLLKNKANIEAQDKNGETALMHAATHGRKEIVELLLKNKVDVDARNHHGGTALFCTAERGYKEIVELLLKNNANIEAQDENGNTVLMYAAHAQYAEIVELLLKNNANVEAQDKNGNTVLMQLPLTSDKIDVVKLILAAKPDLNVKNKNNDTVIMLAKQYGDAEVIKMLEQTENELKEKISGRPKTKKRMTPFKEAKEKQFSKGLKDERDSKEQTKEKTSSTDKKPTRDKRN